jgi:GNAT superfamily N-acetyltransferase
MVDVLIRPARPGDGEGLARTWIDAGAYHASLDPALFQVPDPDGLAHWYEDWLPRMISPYTLFLVAEIDGQVVGCVGAAVQQPVEEAGRQLMRELGLTRLVINAFVVQQAHWREGIGTRLLGAAEEWARGKGAVIALVDTYIDNPVSVPFYEHHMGYGRRALRLARWLV